MITHTIAIKWKEKYDAVVEICHHCLHLCGERMKMSLPKKQKKNIYVVGRLPLLPRSHLGPKFGP